MMMGRSQQLTSLLDLARSIVTAHQTSIAPLQVFSQHVRRLSDDASLQFAKDRKKYDAELSKLRKQWAKDVADKAAEAAEQAAAATQRREAAKAARERQDAAGRETRRQELLAQQAASRRVRAAEKEERLRRQGLRDDILAAAREERKAALLRASASWVAPEDLERRIQEALDNPTPLWKRQ
jgi:hypothetical protein